jgi:NAD(P)-dependent dehydrogenase (short-subunit alcohol dehydrogenase family)
MSRDDAAALESEGRGVGSEKVYLVTGANAGIGRATAERLAETGGTVVLLCRSLARGEEARRAIVAKTGNPRVELLIADLSSQRQIRAVAAEFRARHDRLDVLINNAAVLTRERRLTEDGLELQFAVNHLAPFLLTQLLLDLLKRSSPARIITVSSEAHREGRIDVADLQGARSYRGLRAYRQSKLANILFTRELSRRLKGSGVTANAAHPGAVATRLLFTGWRIARLVRPFLRKPARGAEPSVYLALSPEVAGVSGRYFVDHRPVEPSSRACDPEAAKRLWEISVELTRPRVPT